MIFALPMLLMLNSAPQFEGLDQSRLRAQVEAPLTVNGELVSPALVKRFLIYNVGAPLLEAEIMEAMLELHSGMNGAPDLEVGRRAVEELIPRFVRRYDAANFEFALRTDYGTRSIAEFALATRARFDEYFLPANPEHWPQATLDALAVEADGSLIEDARSTYEEKLSAGGPIVPVGEMHQSNLRAFVFSHLHETFRVEGSGDKLPPNVVLRVTDTSTNSAINFDLEEAFAAVLPALDSELIARERRWVTAMTAVEQRLRADGLLLPSEQVDEARERLEEEYRGCFSLPTATLNEWEFPSLEHYRAYFRLACSYDQVFQEDDLDLSRGELPRRSMTHLKEVNRRSGLARIYAQAVHFSAREVPSGRFSEVSWEAAEIQAASSARSITRECAMLKSQLGPEQLSERGNRGSVKRMWDRVLENHSTEWTPLSILHPPSDGISSVSCGPEPWQSAGVTYHSARAQMKCSSYSEFLETESVADWVTFEQEEGSVSPPMKTPEGYVVVFLVDRMEPTHPLRLSEVHHRKLLRDEASRLEFSEYWRDALRRALER